MELPNNIDFKALILGAALSAVFIILGHHHSYLFYPIAAIGLLYAGYAQNDLKTGLLIGALASTPIIVLTLKGYLGHLNEFFITGIGMITVTVIILFVGAFVGFVGAWAKRDRIKAKEEYEKKQKIGKNKKKNKK